ncbi:MAG: amidohydrolase, partial [Acidobacteriota bacterium]
MREILSSTQNSITKAGPFGLLLLGLILAQFTAPSMAQAPDLIVFNGKIATVDEDMTFVEAMAIRDDTLVSLGSNEDILRLAGPQTKRVDVKGRTVLPGIVDPHRHLGGFRA